MQFQFLAVSGRAAGDASIRDQPPVKSRASPAVPLGSPRNETRSLALSHSPSLILSFSLSPSLSCRRSPCPSLLPTLCLSLALIPVNRLQPPASRVSRRTSSPFRSPPLHFHPPLSLAVSTVLMRQMRSHRATSVSGRALGGPGRYISDELCSPKLGCKVVDFAMSSRLSNACRAPFMVLEDDCASSLLV